MPDGAPHLRLGKAGENAAYQFLEKKGYTILARNWRLKNLELDIVCARNGEIFFVEVKTRKNHRYDQGFGAITKAKIKRVSQAALRWLLKHGKSHLPCHFDVACVYGSQDNFQIVYYRDAFELPITPDCRNAHWQY